jgi:YesN/AraC family two-component response regulator
MPTGIQGGQNAVDVLTALAKLFRYPLEAQLLSAASILDCGGSLEGCPSLLGARLFIGLYTDFEELPREKALSVDAELRSWHQREDVVCIRPGFNPSVCSVQTAKIIEVTRDLIREKLGESLLSDKPRQYYDTIYADRSLMFHHTPYALEERLVQAVIRGDETSALRALSEISRSGEKAILAADPLRSAKNSIIGTIAFLARASIQAGLDPEMVFALSDVLIRTIEGLRSKTEVLAYEEKILFRFIGMVKKRLDQRYSRPIQRTLNYIEAHLDQRLFLEEIAAAVYVNPNYLSGLFRKETGKSLSEFITLRKIQESSYFVRYTDYPFAEIAALYGFSGQSYFTRNFKKVMGKTPGEYRA